MRINWTPEAAEDLEAAVSYLVERNPPAARILAESVFAAVERLASEPLDGAEHVLRTGEVVRGWPLPPFRIYYQRVGGALHVLRVYHQRRERGTIRPAHRHASCSARGAP